jgi:hypothetical protein
MALAQIKGGSLQFFNTGIPGSLRFKPQNAGINTSFLNFPQAPQHKPLGRTVNCEPSTVTHHLSTILNIPELAVFLSYRVGPP